MSRARGYAGLSKLRKTLRRLEPEAAEGIKTSFKHGAELIQYDIIQNGLQHRITGDMLRSVDVKMGRDGLTAVIGPGASRIRIGKSPFDTTMYKSAEGKHQAFQFFKAYWIEFGTKGYPERNIPAQPAQPFVQPAYDANKGWIVRNVQDEIRATLRNVTSGRTQQSLT